MYHLKSHTFYFCFFPYFNQSLIKWFYTTKSNNINHKPPTNIKAMGPQLTCKPKISNIQPDILFHMHEKIKYLQLKARTWIVILANNFVRKVNRIRRQWKANFVRWDFFVWFLRNICVQIMHVANYTVRPNLLAIWNVDFIDFLIWENAKLISVICRILIFWKCPGLLQLITS